MLTVGLDGRTIVFVHPSDELYGADRCLLELVRGLPGGVRAIVVLPRDVAYAGGLARELESAGAEVRRLDYAVLRRSALGPGHWPRLGRRLLVGSLELARLIRECNADIVHTNTLATISGPLAARIAGRRHVWQVHEVIEDERWAIRLVYRLLLMLAPGRIIANSRATARSLAGPLRLLRRRTTVVYPGLPATDQGPCGRHESTTLRIGFVGRLAPRKGLGELLEAVALVHALGTALELRVFGTAPPGQEWREEEFRRRALRLGLGERVRFEGFVDNVRKRLTEIDVLVVPSQRPEPFGLVVLEGMAAGCAVVACRNGGGSDEILSHGRTGLYCGRSPSSIASAIRRLADDPALRMRIGQQARATVHTRFPIDGYRAGVFDIYRDLLSLDQT